MKKINESLQTPIIIVTSNICKDAKNCLDSIGDSIDCNSLAKDLKNAGANVEGKIQGNDTLMIISGLDNDAIMEIINAFINDYKEFHNCESLKTANDYVKVEELVDEPENDDDLENAGYPAYEDVDIEEAENDIKEAENDRDFAIEFSDAITILCTQNEIDIEGNFDQYIDEIFDYVNIETSELSADDYEKLYNIAFKAWNDIKYRHTLDEKKQGCCPPKRIINENESIVLNDIADNALKNKVYKALKAGKEYLHENVKINGKSFKDFTTEELIAIKESVALSKSKLCSSLIGSLNESAEYDSIKESMNKKIQLLNFIDEELTYRETRKISIRAINEAGTISDDELANLFGPSQTTEDEDENKEESSEEKKEEKSSEESKDNEKNDEETSNAEEIELARIEITVKNEDALIDLRNACVDADIPEDAFELVGVDDSAFEEENEENSEEEKSEETEEKPEEAEEKSEETEEKNESVQYVNIDRLFEDEETPATEEENSEENSEEEKPEDSEEEKTEEEYKFILTNTDYAPTLAEILDKLYGITKEEFEDMIGGKIVDESEEDKSSKESETEEKAEGDSEEKTEEKEENSEEDDIDPAELFKGL